MKTKFSFLLLIIFGFIISFSILKSEDNNVKEHPHLLGMTNEGTDFYLTFHPARDGMEMNEKNIYITSRTRTKVTVEIEGKDYKRTQYTIPYDVIEFTLSSHQGQCYRKTQQDTSEPDTVYRKAAIHVYSDYPIICYAIGRGDYTSDGYLSLPVPSLGKEYIVASWNDVTIENKYYLPGYLSIVAPYDNTRVRFTLGGNATSETTGGMKSGDSKPWTIHQGDVLLISTKGMNSDLSGSRIVSSKPVAVISGHYYSYIPSTNPWGNHLIEQELPTQLWGKEYHVTNIVDRKYNSWLRIFANEPNTSIFRDGQFIGKIDSAGGVEGVGFLSMRADEGAARPIVITSDKPCCITQYNTGQGEDSVQSYPFQMTLIPFELYQKEIMFCMPGMKGMGEYANKYINLVYEATDDGKIPDDLIFAEADVNNFEWKQLVEIDSLPGKEFAIQINSKRYFVKTILLPHNGVYKFKANSPFAVYSYGFSHYSLAYGFPAGMALNNLTKVDTEPPKPSFLYDSCGSVGIIPKAKVRDMPEDAENRSNLYEIYFNGDLSYNFAFSHGDFMPCEDMETTWSLIKINDREDSKAVITFSDCAGNDTTITIETFARKFEITPTILDFGKMKVGEVKDKQFWFKNNSTRADAYIKYLYLKKNNYGAPQGFEIHGIDIPQIVHPQDSIPFFIRFSATEEGFFRDSIGVGDSSYFWYMAYVEAKVEEPGDVAENYFNGGEFVEIYQNPLEDILYISFNKDGIGGAFIFKLYDILGNVAMEKKAEHETDNGWFVLNTTQLGNGIYFLKINTSEHVIIRKIAIIH